MKELRRTEVGVSMRKSIIDFVSRFQYTHWVTLNFHDEYSLHTAQRRLQLWARNVERRLFKHAHCSRIELQSSFHFFAFPELTKSGHMHYHILVLIRNDRKYWFEKVAGKMWISLVPTGSADIQCIGVMRSDQIKVIEYATKCTDCPFSYGHFVSGNMCFDDVVISKPTLNSFGVQ